MKEDLSVRHFLRIRARRLVLNMVKTSRFDAEGISDVDLEIYSQPAWIQFRKKLSPEDQKILTIWRSGAVWTPTRRFYRPGSDQMDVRTTCQWCQAPQASARHFFAECPRFSDQRKFLEDKFNLSDLWWGRQPRCCAKTGWITFSSALDFEQRVQCAIAANMLGIFIASALDDQRLAANAG